MKQTLRIIITKIPLINFLVRRVIGLLRWGFFPGTRQYWESRYAKGGTSGPGSYKHLAMFKAEVVNSFVREHNIRSVIEFGCGDGNQLSLTSYPVYIGLDISRTAIRLCKERFQHDETKSFFLYDPECFMDKHSIFKADLTLSLDVIFHLIEDTNFELYMRHLFSSAAKFVIIYSSDTNRHSLATHVKHRQFSKWVELYLPEWKLAKKIPNKYPFEGDIRTGSPSNFFIYENLSYQ